MDFILQPWQLYLVILAGWINRQAHGEIECHQRLGGMLKYYYRNAA